MRNSSAVVRSPGLEFYGPVDGRKLRTPAPGLVPSIGATAALVALTLVLSILTPSRPGPNLSVDPGRVAPGTAVSVGGSAFDRRAVGLLTLDDDASTVDFRADNVGRFTTTLSVPRWAAVGTHTLFAKSRDRKSVIASTTLYVVDPAASLDLTSATFSAVVPSGLRPTALPFDKLAPVAPWPTASWLPNPTRWFEPTLIPGWPTPTTAPTPAVTPAPTSGPSGTHQPKPTPSPTPQPTPSPTPQPTPGPTPRPTPTPTPPPTYNPALGMAAHFMWQGAADTDVDLGRMAAAGMKLARFDFSWANSEPVKGTYLYFDKLDRVLDAVKAHGMRAVITVIETPGWANGGAGKFAPPSNPADYARFIGALAGHNAGRTGMVWEVWNEPNDAHFWTTGPSPSRYAALLKAAYAAINDADPQATVLGGSIVFNDIPFLDGMYAAGAGASFDALAIHPYCGGRAPSDTSNAWFSFARSVPQFTSAMSRHGQSKPIWITEMGWSTSDISDARRAGYLADAVDIARTWSKLRGFAAYTIRQSQFLEYGLITKSGAETLSWKAYAAAQ